MVEHDNYTTWKVLECRTEWIDGRTTLPAQHGKFYNVGQSGLVVEQHC